MIGNIPDGWRVEKLDSLCKFMNGYAFSSKDYVEYSNVVNIRMSNIRPNASFDYTHNIKYLPEEYAEKYKQYQLDDNDVILAMTDMGKAMNILGVPTEVKKPDNIVFLLNQRVGKLYDFDLKKISTSYIKKALSTEYIHNFYKQLGGGGLQINLSKKDILSAKIPIPPLPQQEKIVKVLDISSALIEKQKELIQKYDLFLKSKFIELFGDPVLNPMGWKMVKMGSMMKIRRGASPRPIDKFIGNDVPWIKIGDGSKGNDLYIEDTKVKIIKEGASKSVFLKKGSLVFANCGVSLGFSRILKIDGCIHDGWLSFEEIDDKLNKLFILKLINHSTQRLRDSASGGTQPNLNIGIMKNFTIYLPPIELQSKFASIVEKTEQIKEQEAQKLEHLQTLHNSLMEKAFRGEII